MFSWKYAVAPALLIAAWAMPATAGYFPPGWDNVVTVDKDDIGLNFVVDFSGKVDDNYTSNLSALGSFTFTSVTNAGKTFNFSYSMTNDSNYDSRIRAFGFDTQSPSPNPTSVNGITGFTYEERNVNFIEGVGTMDMCFSAGSGCTNHSSGGINDGSTMNGTFSMTFANVMESVDFNHFAMKFLSVNPTIGGRDWGAGLGTIVSVTPPGGTPITAPEPGTWMMMLVGFGLVGGILRSARNVRQPSLAAAY